MMRNVILAGVIGSVMIAVYAMGYFSGKNAVKLGDFEEYKLLVKKRDSLQSELNDKDVALLEAQRERNELRDKEVVKHVTVYRDRIKDPGIAECVRNSGLLDVYDATVSAPGK
nr:MAG TPA: hypothetical protein [Caudoviricetes sp.]